LVRCCASLWGTRICGSGFVIAAKTAVGVDTGRLEEALATLVKIPIPVSPNDLDAFRHWEQAEINVSVTLADLFRSILGAGPCPRAAITLWP
jgi:hypothetical protein